MHVLRLLAFLVLHALRSVLLLHSLSLCCAPAVALLRDLPYLPSDPTAAGPSAAGKGAGVLGGVASAWCLTSVARAVVVVAAAALAGVTVVSVREKGAARARQWLGARIWGGLMRYAHTTRHNTV